MDDSSVKWSALVAATLAAFLPPFMGSSITIALPSIGNEFALDAVSLSWVATSYLLAAAIFLVPFGRIADIRGRKKIFAYGTLVYTLSSLLSAVSPSAVALIAFRILQGIGSAMIYGTGVAILTGLFPAGERGKVLGWNTAGVYTGLSVGPVLGGFLTEQWGWRSIFLANVPLGLIIIVFVLWKLKGEWAAADGERFDLAGSIVFSLSLVAPLITSATINSGVITLDWATFPGVTYRVQFSASLSAPNWLDLPGQVTATGLSASTSDPLTVSNRFYRVVALP